jgi:hypothetical protein
MGKSKKQVSPKTEKPKNEKFTKSLRQKGGVYFYCGAIMGRKNVFVTDEYINLLVNAFKMAELRKDVKNLGYVIMPNFFYWMFRLSEKNDNPVDVYKDVKKQVALEILQNLSKEQREGSYEIAKLFQGNERVGRSKPEKILWTFEEYGKKFENTKRYKVWVPRTEIRLIDNDELLQQKVTVMQKAPVSERWQMVNRSSKYPYMHLDEEIHVDVVDDLKLDNVCQKMPQSLAEVVV